MRRASVGIHEKLPFTAMSANLRDPFESKQTTSFSDFSRSDSPLWLNLKSEPYSEPSDHSIYLAASSTIVSILGNSKIPPYPIISLHLFIMKAASGRKVDDSDLDRERPTYTFN